MAVVSFLGLSLAAAVFVQAQTHPRPRDAHDIECGGGISAHDSYWIVPSGDAPKQSLDALAEYMEQVPGIRHSARSPDEYRLHDDSQSTDRLRYIHPTSEGFDAEVLVVRIWNRWYVESSTACAAG
jgi:hypothetical protein